MSCPVYLLVVPRAFMLPDDPGLVVLDVTAGDYAVLHMATSCLPIDIHCRFIFPQESAIRLERREVLDSFRIDFIGIEIGADRKIYLGMSHMQKAVRIARHKSRCPIRINHVVRNSRNACGQVLRRSQRLESMYPHMILPSRRGSVTSGFPPDTLFENEDEGRGRLRFILSSVIGYSLLDIGYSSS